MTTLYTKLYQLNSYTHYEVLLAWKIELSIVFLAIFHFYSCNLEFVFLKDRWTMLGKKKPKEYSMNFGKKERYFWNCSNVKERTTFILQINTYLKNWVDQLTVFCLSLKETSLHLIATLLPNILPRILWVIIIYLAMRMNFMNILENCDHNFASDKYIIMELK